MLSAAGYGQLIAALTHWADQHAQGRIVLILEGGYDLDAAAACSLAVTAALLGQEYADPLGPSPYAENSAWRSTVERARQLWGLASTP
jgi:acetoin utilization deacetylase AcuC-like enzyme